MRVWSKEVGSKFLFLFVVVKYLLLTLQSIEARYYRIEA